MCYSAESIEHNSLRAALRRTKDLAERKILQKKLDDLFSKAVRYYYADAFAHPNLLVFTNTQPFEPQLMHWGLIPSWVKDNSSAKIIANKTLNARAETIFEKAAFKSSAKSKRCLIFLESFFEHHHFNGKTYPFRISMKDGSPIILAGLWEDWVNKDTGEIIKTVTIVTTLGNSLMERIHNNPKADGPRMPVILNEDKQDEWLKTIETEEEKACILSLLKPFDHKSLVAYPVRQLKGKNALGNTPEVLEPVDYPELDLSFLATEQN
jgi:putative SOS response-associated peptidase YedK